LQFMSILAIFCLQNYNQIDDNDTLQTFYQIDVHKNMKLLKDQFIKLAIKLGKIQSVLRDVLCLM